MDAHLYIPAKRIEVEDPQVVIAKAFREFNVAHFDVKHFPLHDRAYWSMHLADESTLSWTQSDHLTPDVLDVLRSFSAQCGGAKVKVVHLSENGEYMGYDEV